MFQMNGIKPLLRLYTKKGSRADCSNYRSISLICVTSKIFERVIAHQMRDFLINNNIINCAQHGFTFGRSTCANLLECLNDWTLCIQDKQQVIVAYIDFSKAFDVMSHSKWCNPRKCVRPSDVPCVYQRAC